MLVAQDGKRYKLCEDGNEHLLIERIKRITERNKDMTPQEELFAKFFNSEAPLVAAMDSLTLRAHIETLSEIALEARAKLSSALHEEDNRARKGGKTFGLERSVSTDQTTSDAINAIERRNQRLNKKEKLRKSLEAMGVDSKDIDQIMSARNIREIVETPKATKSGDGIDWDKVVAEAKEKEAQQANKVESKIDFDIFGE